MSGFSENIVNQRFGLVYAHLVQEGRIKGKSDLAQYLGTYNHVINSILRGGRNITVDQINALCKHFGIDANFLFGTSNNIYGDPQSAQGVAAYPPIGSEARRNNIALVPVRALAGYALHAGQSEYLEDLQRFSVPSLEGELIAFEISGDSMLPYITNGDLVICEALERDEPIKDNAVYVIVTDVVVTKRVQQIKQGNQLVSLRLISDNEVYRPYEVPVEEIKQILKVKLRLTSYGIS